MIPATSATLRSSWPIFCTLDDSGPLLLSAMLWVTLWLVPLLLLAVAGYALFRLPLQRRERAGLFLDLLDALLRRGQPLEETLIAISKTRDRTMSVRFHLLAAHLEQGLSLSRALERVPRFLPPTVTGMLRAGELLGDLRRVLPACRCTLQDAITETRSAVNYLVVLAFVITPATALLPLLVFRLIIPSYRETFAGMTTTSLPAYLSLLDRVQPLITAGLIILMIVLWIGAIAYVGGPRFSAWLQAGIPRILDAAAMRLPWQRRRMQRDFCAVLALLLDGGVPEPEAMRMAADCVPNALFRARVERGRSKLEGGCRLSEAMRAVDRSGEFHWRLRHASTSCIGFSRALKGWLEALDAKACQQEMATAHVLSTTLVLLNGLIIGSVMMALFGSLVSIIETGLLW